MLKSWLKSINVAEISHCNELDMKNTVQCSHIKKLKNNYFQTTYILSIPTVLSLRKDKKGSTPW